MIFSGKTFADFTLIPGTYVYTIPNDEVVLNIAAATVPDPGSSLLLLGMGLAGLRAWKKRIG